VKRPDAIFSAFFSKLSAKFRLAPPLKTPHFTFFKQTSQTNVNAAPAARDKDVKKRTLETRKLERPRRPIGVLRRRLASAKSPRFT
jgi:hypothetical protein